MIQLIPSILLAVFLIYSPHLTTCSSIMSTDLIESHNEDVVPPIDDATSLTKKKDSTNSGVKLNAKVERALQEEWMQDMLNLVNDERSSRGFNALCFNGKLNMAAQEHSDDMVTNNFFSHKDLNGDLPKQRMAEAGYQNAKRSGENIAINRSVKKAHDAWMASAGHKRNILNPDFQHMGLGRTVKQNGNNAQEYYTQTFGRSPTETCNGATTQTSAPTNAPTNAPPNVPSSPDKDSNNDSCVDSPLRFKVIGKRGTKDCTWASKVSARCDIKGVRETCPSTC